jgi:WD40 repeat protein
MTMHVQTNIECAKEIVSVCFHPNNRSLALLSRTGTVEEWNLSTDTHSTYNYDLPEADKRGDSWYGNVAYNADGTRVICYWSAIDAILVWSTEDRSQPLMEITIPAMNINTFSLDSDGIHVDALIAPKGDPVFVKRWNTEIGDEVRSLQMQRSLRATQC